MHFVDGCPRQLRAIKRYFRLTWAELSDLTGFPAETLRRHVTLEKAMAVCQALGISLDSLRPGAPVVIYAGPGDILWTVKPTKWSRVPVHRMFTSKARR